MIRGVVICVVTALILSTSSARGSAIITVAQSGADVVATGTGTLDLAALTGNFSSSDSGSLNAVNGSVRVGIGNDDGYEGTFVTPSTPFGTQNNSSDSSANGDLFGFRLIGSTIFLVVPDGYVSGSALSGSATWDNTTISGLGLTPGVYTWTWGSGATADYLELDIPGATPVPEPSGQILAISAIALIGFGAWVRRWRVAAVAA